MHTRYTDSPWNLFVISAPISAIRLCLNKKLCDSVSLCLIEWSAHIHVDVAYKGLVVVIDIRIGQSFFYYISLVFYLY